MKRSSVISIFAILTCLVIGGIELLAQRIKPLAAILAIRIDWFGYLLIAVCLVVLVRLVYLYRRDRSRWKF